MMARMTGHTIWYICCILAIVPKGCDTTFPDLVFFVFIQDDPSIQQRILHDKFGVRSPI